MEPVWRYNAQFQTRLSAFTHNQRAKFQASQKPSALDTYQAPATTPTKRGGVSRSIIDSPSGATSSFLFCLLICIRARRWWRLLMRCSDPVASDRHRAGVPSGSFNWSVPLVTDSHFNHPQCPLLVAPIHKSSPPKRFTPAAPPRIC